MSECKFFKHELRIMIREILREELNFLKLDLRNEDSGRRIDELVLKLKAEAAEREQKKWRLPK